MLAESLSKARTIPYSRSPESNRTGSASASLDKSGTQRPFLKQEIDDLRIRTEISAQDFFGDIDNRPIRLSGNVNPWVKD